MEHIPITHAPQGAGSRISAGQRHFRPQPYLRSGLLSLHHVPDLLDTCRAHQSSPARNMMAASRAWPRTRLSFPSTDRYLPGQPCAKPSSQPRKKTAIPKDDGLFASTLFFCSPGQTSCTMLLSRPLQSRNNRRYFFRASESTMAWAWASSTFPASRTSTCLSAPRASTPRMGMFPAWPCIS